MTSAKRIMPIKCLFINIEGVITPLNCPLPRCYWEMTRSLAKKLLILKLVAYVSRCKLVLTGITPSDRRLVSLFNSILNSWEINPVYSTTQPFHLEKCIVKMRPENRRAWEVEQWIACRNVKSWCVVDMMNLSILEKDGIKKTVMVNGNIGLTMEDIQKMLDILGVELDLYS